MIPMQAPLGLNPWTLSLISILKKNNNPRIKLSTPQKPRTLGGFKASNYLHYLLASQLQYMRFIKWINPNHSIDTVPLTNQYSSAINW